MSDCDNCIMNFREDCSGIDCISVRIAMAEHDKQICDGVISEILKQVEFEEKWLSDAWKDNGYNYSSRDVDIAFSGIKHKLRQMKGEQNE